MKVVTYQIDRRDLNEEPTKLDAKDGLDKRFPNSAVTVFFAELAVLVAFSRAASRKRAFQHAFGETEFFAQLLDCFQCFSFLALLGLNQLAFQLLHFRFDLLVAFHKLLLRGC